MAKALVGEAGTGRLACEQPIGDVGQGAADRQGVARALGGAEDHEPAERTRYWRVRPCTGAETEAPSKVGHVERGTGRLLCDASKA
jgi:hypothetical protein